MKESNTSPSPKPRPVKAAGPQFEDRVLLGFVVVATLAMAWISWPFFGAILWALVVTIAFAPLHDRLLMLRPHRRNSVALVSLLLVIALVIIPAFVVGSLLVEEALKTYQMMQTRELDLGKAMHDVQSAIPREWRIYAERYFNADINQLQTKVSSILTGGLQLIAGQAVDLGQRAFSFALSLGVMLYLTFFLLRDSRQLSRRIGELMPMRPEQRGALFQKFTTVVRATVKGSVIVAIVQGVLGGVIFALLDIHAALLWGVVMGLLALIPAVGTGLVWVPVSIYLLATGSVTEGIVLLLCGVFVISMIDNVLRPILVGQDTRMPDYVVLISTLGGLSVLGINGLIVGPVIAAMFISAWEIFGESRAAHRH
jgi:predicted PurR-regulated permease PerM